MRYVVLLIIALAIFASCSSDEYEPRMSLELASESISADTGVISEPVDVTVRKEDKERVNAQVDVVLRTQHPELVFYAASDEQQIDSLHDVSMHRFSAQGDQKTDSFRVLVNRNGTAVKSEYHANVLLYFNNTLLENKTLKVIVK